MKKILIIIVVLQFFTTKNFSQTLVSTSPVKWYTIEEGFALYKQNPKPIIIDVYTDWCGWCIKMMNTTFSNQGIADYINLNFIPVRFDAETKDTIFYNDSAYISKGKTHDLAIELLDSRLSYPTLIYFDRAGNKNLVPGYMDIQDIEPLLVYFAEDLSNFVNYQDFNLAYMFSYPINFSEKIKLLSVEQKLDTLGTVKWLTFDEAAKLNIEQPKPFLIDMYVDWCNSCKVMKKAIYRNSVLADYINENFYPVSFNAAEQNPIVFNGTTYNSLGVGQPHQLAMAIMQSKFIFPSTVFFNSNYELLNIINGYFGTIQLEPILKYYGSDNYKTLDFQTFYKTFTSEIK